MKNIMMVVMVGIVWLGVGTSLVCAESGEAFPTSRDPRLWPFRQDSIWNMPIGSDAVYVDAKLHRATRMGMTVDEDIIIMTPDAPMTDIYENHAGWNWKDRCPIQGPLVLTAPIPANFVRPSGPGTPNSCLAVLMPDGVTIKQNQPFARCTAGGHATSFYVYPDDNIITGDGIKGAHGGSGMSSMGGTLRLGELVPGAGPIRHALKINVDGRVDLYYDEATKGYRWPAWKADSGAAGYYGGGVPDCRMGALLAIPPSIDINDMGLETAPALMLARAMQDYGAYIVDCTGWSVYAIAIEWSPDGLVPDEFQREWGFSMTGQSKNVPWSRDMDRIFGALQAVANNGPDSIGGGGTPRQPLAPPFKVPTK